MSDSSLIEKILKTQMKKLILAGPTGAGKTTIFTSIFPFKSELLSEVKRNIKKEQASELAFSVIDEDEFKNSTTTVSFNVTTIVACINRANKMTIHELKNPTFLLDDEYDFILPLQIIDIAGQDRFFFMVDTMVRGTSGAIYVADGTNITSVNNLPKYIDAVRAEGIRRDTTIPGIVFVHKSDLRERSMYVGKEVAESALPPEYQIFETTVKDPDTITIPLRMLIMDMFDDFLNTEKLANYLRNLKLLQGKR